MNCVEVVRGEEQEGALERKASLLPTCAPRASRGNANKIKKPKGTHMSEMSFNSN